MIRRAFWLSAGAAAGIYGYRRVSAAGRQLSGRLSLSVPAVPAVAAVPARPRSGRGALALARQTYRFTRDVREGMALYMARRSELPGSTLTTDHDVRPEDGH